MADGLQGKVEVAFATPQQQIMIEVDLEPGMTIEEAIRRSGLQASFPDNDLTELPTGIWGRKCDRQMPVSAGDRVEIYRPLILTPQEARRRRAEDQRQNQKQNQKTD